MWVSNSRVGYLSIPFTRAWALPLPLNEMLTCTPGRQRHTDEEAVRHERVRVAQRHHCSPASYERAEVGYDCTDWQ